MRILASHYALLPDLRLAKYPKIHINELNVIELVEEKDQGFVETPSTEFFGGLMIPGFIADLSNLETSITSSQLNLLLGRLYRDGIQYVILPLDVKAVLDTKANTGITFLFNEIASCNTIHFDTVISPWQKVCEEVKSGKNENIIELLAQYLVQPWQQWQEQLPGGKIEIGSKPGILLINGINWTTLTFSKTLTIQRLHGC